MPEKTYISGDLGDNPDIAKSILESCKDVRIFAFYGELGAGKTTLIRSFCKVLGVNERVSSPTFGLVHEYEGKEAYIYHFDLYRLNHEDEAYEMGFDEYLESGNYCFIEWPERVPSFLPTNHASIRLEVESPSRRSITLTHV
ncbi:MAG: tRNA (adenosine(37)-N6)-threonylcarbamoyltransferase complex ATPase subunit type 1 TsaE [Bacteroidota bacterium]